MQSRSTNAAPGLKLLRELVAIDTDSLQKSNYTEISNVLRQALIDIGAKVTIVSPKAEDGKPRPNVIGRIDNGSEETLALNAHYDVVPVNRGDWHGYDPFELRVVGDKAFGRGSNDDKGGIVIALEAMKKAKKAPNLEIFFVCDEESGSQMGTEAVVASEHKKLRSTSAVILDGESVISIGGSGGIGGRLIFKGKEYHAGFPFNAINPIETAMPFLVELVKFKGLVAQNVSRYSDASTGRKPYDRFSITMIHGGIKENLIPGILEVRFDLRCTPEGSVADVVGRFRNYFEQLKKRSGVDVSFDVLYEHANYITKEDAPIIRRLQKIIGKKELYASFGGNDGAYYVNAGIPAVTYGVFNESAHQANEYVSLKEMQRVEENLVKLLESFG